MADPCQDWPHEASMRAAVREFKATQLSARVFVLFQLDGVSYAFDADAFTLAGALAMPPPWRTGKVVVHDWRRVEAAIKVITEGGNQCFIMEWSPR